MASYYGSGVYGQTSVPVITATLGSGTYFSPRPAVWPASVPVGAGIRSLEAPTITGTGLSPLATVTPLTVGGITINAPYNVTQALMQDAITRLTASTAQASVQQANVAVPGGAGGVVAPNQWAPIVQQNVPPAVAARRAAVAAAQAKGIEDLTAGLGLVKDGNNLDVDLADSAGLNFDGPPPGGKLKVKYDVNSMDIDIVHGELKPKTQSDVSKLTITQDETGVQFQVTDDSGTHEYWSIDIGLTPEGVVSNITEAAP